MVPGEQLRLPLAWPSWAGSQAECTRYCRLGLRAALAACDRETGKTAMRCGLAVRTNAHGC